MNVMITIVAASLSIGWRTDGTGRYDQATPPLEWGPQKNVVWAAATPARSHSTPVISADRIFITGEPGTLLCLAKADGKILWQDVLLYEDLLGPKDLDRKKQAEQIQEELKPLERKLNQVQREIKKIEKDPNAVARRQELTTQQADAKAQVEAVRKRLNPLKDALIPPTEGSNGYASATPVTDGEVVCAVYGFGAAVCCDLEGKRLWVKAVDRPANGWGHSASPLLLDGKLIVHVKDLVALDVKTGNELWRTPAAVHFGTPVAAKVGADFVIVTPEGDFIRAGDGKKLAAVPAKLEYNAPVLCDGVAYFACRENGQGLAVRLPAKAEEFKPEVVWEGQFPKERYYGSPACRDGLLYAVTQNGELSVIEAATGKPVYSRTPEGLKGRVFTSVTIAGPYVFLSVESGSSVILQAGREHKQVARNSLGTFRSCPVFEGRRMYVRTQDKLYCIEGPP